MSFRTSLRTRPRSNALRRTPIPPAGPTGRHRTHLPSKGAAHAPRRTRPALASLVATLLAVVLGTSAAVVGAARPAVAQTVAPGGTYTPLTPARILDTRTGVGRSPGVIGAGYVEVTVLGTGGVPTSNVDAVVINVTVTEPTAATYLSVYPAGKPVPNASNINTIRNLTAANLVTVKVGTSGRVAFYNASGTIHLIADVQGWYSTNGTGRAGRLHTVTPQRVLDTRATAPVGSGQTINVRLAGVGGVPASGASAVALNVTAVSPQADGYLTVWPAGAPRPEASNVNFTAGATTANAVFATLGSGGQVSIAAPAGAAHVLVDVTGWVTDPAAADSTNRFTSLDPARLLDTRTGTGATAAAVGPDRNVAVQVTGRGGVPGSGVAAVVVNVTVVDPSSDGYVTAYPNGGTVPNVSTVNFRAGRTIANLATVPVATDGRIALFNKSGSSHLLVDVVGWWSGEPMPTTPPGPSGTRCVLVLHGKGGTGAATRTRADGALEVAPYGNATAPASWGGNYQWLYANEADYTAARALVTAAADAAGCGQIALAGFSNGGAFAAKLACRAETFGGRLLGVVLGDPVPDQVVDGCGFAAGVTLKLIQSDWMDAQVGSGRSCIPDWTCQGSLYSLSAYAAKLGNPTPVRIATHTPGDLGAWAASWWR